MKKGMKEKVRGQEFFEREVLPFAPDAWMDREKDKIGYEIPLTKYFYEYKPLRDLDLIMKDIEELEEQTETLLEEFSLTHVRKNKGIVCSGGERRRTEIARALSVDPKFILLDEPFAGVDPIAVEEIQEIVAKLKNRNIGILITDHNVNETLSITDRAYLLFEGKILRQGTAEELASDELVRKV